MSYSTGNPSPIKYRPEIDGLRAIAVLAVVLFHGEMVVDAYGFKGLNPFKGGFIGIDIFFVISGYLITSIILQEAAAGSFSLRDFWLRRVKRLVPALVFVVLAILPFVGYFMPYSMVEEYVGSAWSALGFVSNFWFLLEDGYWASPAKLKPLLHTWSLGVEAQFYLVFAPLLWAVWRFYRGYVFGVIAGLSVASLVAAQMLSTYYPNEVFFLLPTRFWELGAGALLAKLELTHPPNAINPPKSHPKHKSRNSHNRLANLLPTVGLLMIVLPIYFYEGELDHPPLLNLIPVAGTMLIIRFSGTRGEPTTRLLTSKPFVGLGLVSYSFYLWHQPLLALVRIDNYTYGGLTTDLEILKYTGFALLLAVVSYFLVEKPFRRFKLHKLKSKGARVAAAGAMTLTLAGAVVGTEALSRWGKHIEAQFNKIVSLNDGREVSLPYCDPFYEKIELCPLGELSGITDWSHNPKLDFILVADSHGFPAYSNINRWAKKHHKKGAGVVLGACGALVNVPIKWEEGVGGFNSKRCYELRQQTLAKTTKQTTVILISRWWVYPKYVRHPEAPNEELSKPEGIQLFSEKIEETIKAFSSKGAKVYVLLTVPEQPFNTSAFYQKYIKNKGIFGSGNAIPSIKEKLNSKAIKTSKHLARHKWVNELIAGISQPLGNVDVLDPTGILCGEDICHAVHHWQKPLYGNTVHMNPTGFTLLEPLFEPIFAKMGE